MSKRTRQHEDQLTFDLRVKRCPRCERELPGWEFNRNKHKKNGLATYCRPCVSLHTAEYFERSEEQREKKRLYQKGWRRKNNDRRRELNKVWRTENHERHMASSAAYRRANAAKQAEQVKAWQKAHPEFTKAKNARRRAMRVAAPTVPFTAQQLAERWAYYGDRCWICSAPATATDHVKPLAKGGAHMLCNLRPSCRSCNSRKADIWPFSPEMLLDK